MDLAGRERRVHSPYRLAPGLSFALKCERSSPADVASFSRIIARFPGPGSSFSVLHVQSSGQVAQLVEQRTDNKPFEACCGETDRQVMLKPQHAPLVAAETNL